MQQRIRGHNSLAKYSPVNAVLSLPLLAGSCDANCQNGTPGKRRIRSDRIADVFTYSYLTSACSGSTYAQLYFCHRFDFTGRKQAVQCSSGVVKCFIEMVWSTDGNGMPTETRWIYSHICSQTEPIAVYENNPSCGGRESRRPNTLLVLSACRVGGEMRQLPADCRYWRSLPAIAIALLPNFATLTPTVFCS